MSKPEISHLGPIADAIRQAGEERIENLKKYGPVKTYVMYTDPYTRGMGGEPPLMGMFQGTYRQMLEFLRVGNVDDAEPSDIENLSKLSDKELLDVINEENGDGGPYHAVYCVDDRKVILGAESVD